jgi:hypothetical protein
MGRRTKAIGAITVGCGLLLAAAGCSCSLSRCGSGFIAWGERSEQLVPSSCADSDEASSGCAHGPGCTNFGCRRGFLPGIFRAVQRACWSLRPDTCHTCGRARHGETAGADPPGVQEHSRYHPVPTQPAFSPRVDELAPLADSPAHDRSGSAAPVQMTPPMRTKPQETTVPNANEDDRTTRAPRPLATPSSQSQGATPQAARRPSSWVFVPPAPLKQPPAPEPELPLEPKERMKAEWKAVQR